MINPPVLAFLAAMATFFIVMGILRPEGSIFAATSAEGILSSIEGKLKRAGIVSMTPASVLVGGVVAMGLTALITFFTTSNLIPAIFFASLVPFLISFDLDRRARKWQDKLTARLVPFLRKIESQVRSGQNPTRAFATAVQEDELLRWVLREQLQNLQLNQPFQQVLRDTLDVMPIRPWVQFVRSMEAFSESGGKLAEILSTNVARINSQILLRQRLMGDVAQYRAQQAVILGFAVVIPIILFVTASDTFGSIFASFFGIIMFLAAVGLDMLALWITNNAVRDVERRLEA